jgi:hypothetical protein
VRTGTPGIPSHTSRAFIHAGIVKHLEERVKLGNRLGEVRQPKEAADRLRKAAEAGDPEGTHPHDA